MTNVLRYSETSRVRRAFSLFRFFAFLLCISGCGGDARVELSAADALTATAAQMRVALDEYHAEVESYDDERESAMAGAFVQRVVRDKDDAAKLDAHTQQFAAAMAKIRADRRVEWQRRTAAETQIDVVLEIARGLRRIGIESLTLQDEMRRYLTTWMNARTESARAETGTAK